MNLVRVLDNLDPILEDLIKNEGLETKAFLISY